MRVGGTIATVGVGWTGEGVGRPLTSHPQVPIRRAISRSKATRTRFMDGIIARKGIVEIKTAQVVGPSGDAGSGYDRTRTYDLSDVNRTL